MRRRKVRNTYKRIMKHHINPEKFWLLRMTCCMTKTQCAAFLNVTRRTITEWEKGNTRIPYSAFRLLRLKANGGIAEKEWDGWSISGDTLWSPDGRSWKQHELYYVANYFAMARHWQSDYQKKAESKKAFNKRRLSHGFKVIDGGLS